MIYDKSFIPNFLREYTSHLFMAPYLQVWFVGEKVGEGIGRTRKEAQHHASESSLRNLASKRCHDYQSITIFPGLYDPVNISLYFNR